MAPRFPRPVSCTRTCTCSAPLVHAIRSNSQCSTSDRPDCLYSMVDHVVEQGA